ncbi:MAG: bifunctional diguanylate cyclase/phosphodiesterase [Desulfuromonadales bacterium]
MSDRNKTKLQLLAEIGTLRSRITELERASATSSRSDVKPDQFDILTGLPNRASFFENLKHAVKTAHRDGAQLAVLFFCLDRFKLINDTLGHSVGDMLLKMVASRLTGCIHRNDFLCRPGRDEFIMLVTESIEQHHVVQIAEDIFFALSAAFVLDRHELVIGGSLGICMYPDGSDNAELLIKNAYSAMQQAREAGKNHFRFFSPHLNASEFSRLLLENDLRVALNRFDFSLRFQPQMELRNGEIIGMEALIRWEHPELGFVAPDEFIPLAEQVGLIEPIGEWVLKEACEHHVLSQKFGCAPLRSAVNLSPIQLHRKGIVQRISEILELTGMSPHCLELEITEGAIMKDYRKIVSTLGALYGMGINIAVDDFGTGYSSLAYLSQFPISKLKIDKSFVSAITTDQKCATISRTIVTLAHSLGMQVIAEGVETVEQLDFLRTLNCDEIQGFLLSRPLMSGDCIRFLTAAQQGKKSSEDLQIVV